jgi:chromosome partitioning protein
MLEEQRLDPFYVAQPGTAFERLADAGSNFLQRVREAVNQPEQTKRLRKFGIQEAARMVGKSAATIRQSESSDPRFEALGPTERDGAGHRIYTLARINQYRALFGTAKTRPPGSRAIRCIVTNFKGGAGKTTTAIHLAQKCALEGYRVLMVDLDPQASSTLFFGLIPDVDPAETIGDVLVDNPAAIESVIRQTYFTGVDLVPSNLTLQNAELILANPGHNQAEALGINPVDRLLHSLDTVEELYDVIVMDCGPNLGIMTLNAIRASTGLLMPMQPMMADFASAVLYSQTMASVLGQKKIAHPLDFLRVLITRHSGSAEAKDTEAMIRVAFKPHVLESTMVHTVEVERATNDFGSIYDIEQPRGSAEAYKRALGAVDKVNDEIVQMFEAVWRRQAGLAAKAA